jgi:hypothetical protein
VDRLKVAIVLGTAMVVAWSLALAAPPQYDIYDIGLVQPADAASQGFGVSPNGIATGRSFGSPTHAFTWTQAGGLVGLPNLASPARNFSVGNAANSSGTVVGTGATTSFGSNPLPLMWKNGSVSQLPLPSGQTIGRGFGVNAQDVGVGSVGAGTGEFGVIYSGATATIITTTTATGCFVRTAYGINDQGLVAGFGIDPNNAARNVGFLYDSATNTASEVGGLPGMNGAIAFAVSNGGHVVGSSMNNQGPGLPFIWTEPAGIQPIPLPAGTSQGSARGVNRQGWAVGTASSAYAIPFLYDGTATYRIQDLLSPGSGWDVSTNTSSSAMGISDDGVIVGTGVHDGAIRAYAMVPRPIEAPIDIKPGGCPNPFNRSSHGVLPVALAGSDALNLSDIDRSTVRLARADGVGGSVAPVEGPPGPGTEYEDVTTPFVGETCSCSDLGPDGVMDLSMKFKVDDVVSALHLQSLDPGEWVALVLSGSLTTGETFAGHDCVLLVPPGTPPGLVSVSASASGTWIDVHPMDLTMDGGGFANFDRSYGQSTIATLEAPAFSDGRTFQRWIVNGLAQPDGQNIINLLVISDTATVRAEYGPKNLMISPGKPGSQNLAPGAPTTSVEP